MRPAAYLVCGIALLATGAGLITHAATNGIALAGLTSCFAGLYAIARAAFAMQRD